MTEDLTLTDEQRELIHADPNDRILVVAGAGTGKTAALIARIQHLTRKHDISVASELLVLTFSRAAVSELQRRLRSTGEAAAYVKVSTFDSFATRMLSLYSEDDSWTEADYNGRIRLALQLLDREEEAKAHLKNYRHMVVDEIQDLVADRARLVLAIISGIQGGCTLAGDPAQGIYDFQLAETEDELDSRVFLKRLSDVSGRSLRRIQFTKNYRALSDEARVALRVGPHLANPAADLTKVQDDLTAIVERLEVIPSKHLPDLLTRRASTGSSVGILARYNGQALVLSRLLCEHGVGHRLQRPATERSIAPWVGGVFYDFRGGRVTAERLEELLAKRRDDSAPDSDHAWELLRRTAGSAGPAIELRHLSRRMLAGRIPDELTWHPPAEVVVSTVHRAKGLEFDEVFVVDPKGWEQEEAPEEEARTLYVALTRARKAMRILNPPGPRRLARRDMPGDRWVWLGRKEWQRFGMEVRGSDVKTSVPPSGEPYGRSREVQEYLRRQVTPRDSVELSRFVVRSDQGPRVHYRILHDGRPIGETSPAFSSDLYRILSAASPGRRRVRFPSALQELTVESIETCPGSPLVARQVGLGNSGIWLRPRVVGLARFDW